MYGYRASALVCRLACRKVLTWPRARPPMPKTAPCRIGDSIWSRTVRYRSGHLGRAGQKFSGLDRHRAYCPQRNAPLNTKATHPQLWLARGGTRGHDPMRLFAGFVATMVVETVLLGLLGRLLVDFVNKAANRGQVGLLEAHVGN